MTLRLVRWLVVGGGGGGGGGSLVSWLGSLVGSASRLVEPQPTTSP